MSALKPGLGPSSDAEARQPKVITPELRREAINGIEQLMVAGLSMSKIEEACKSRFGLKPKKVKEYAAVVRARWAEEEKDARPVYKQQAMRRLINHINAAVKEKNFAAVAQFERLLSEMQGTKEAAQVHVDVGVVTSQALLHVVGNLTPEKRAEIIRLQRERLGEAGVRALVAAAAPAIVEATGEETPADGGSGG